MSHRIVPERVTAKGFGESRPTASNDTYEGRQRNRRVEIVIGEDAGAQAVVSAIRRAEEGVGDVKRTNERSRGESTVGWRTPGALVLCLSSSLFSAGVMAAPKLVAQTEESRPTFRTTADSVLLQVSVLDGNGIPVLGLSREYFTVLEDGVPQTIAFFEHRPSSEAVPTGIVHLIDTSSSMNGEELAEARRAAVRLVESAPSHA